MGSLTTLGILLLILMIIVGGKQGIAAFLSMLINFGILFFSIVLMAFHLPPIAVTLVASVILLSITIFWSSASDNASATAFQASVLILIVLILLIIPIEYWARVGGFGLEDSEELEGLSLYVGISFTKLVISTAILSSLGAIAEAAIAIASGLDEIVTQHPKIKSSQLFFDGLVIGKQIIGTAVNTLFFGFFGSSMGLFIWFYGLHYSLGDILNDKVFAAELIAIIISLIGVVLTIPGTTLMMSRRLKRKQEKEKAKSD
ncbi:YibE/F family protein [Lentilactobacillus raoultii]|uniref:YibE/F family protein n=1 Tax=Lentilactobacillus raoultii TaxID=1987503 RepID=A0ABW3PH71_9LACO|nr:YibE/F family protein [Lentilactobacillus raoultii]